MRAGRRFWEIAFLGRFARSRRVCPVRGAPGGLGPCDHLELRGGYKYSSSPSNWLNIETLAPMEVLLTSISKSVGRSVPGAGGAAPGGAHGWPCRPRCRRRPPPPGGPPGPQLAKNGRFSTFSRTGGRFPCATAHGYKMSSPPLPSQCFGSRGVMTDTPSLPEDRLANTLQMGARRKQHAQKLRDPTHISAQ